MSCWTSAMDAEQIKSQFETENSHEIYKAIWAILRCKDKTELEKLKPHMPALKKVIARVDLGGVFRRNKDDCKNAFQHIQDMCAGKCHCTAYLGANLRSPTVEEKYDLVKIVGKDIHADLYEAHYFVDCTGCTKKFRVREVLGWHIPWYDWVIL
ncbi:MAG TPA: hypothetical protein VN030_09205 [Cellvibrio sp.]|nr:hypothetical protein [Cellvibrio sp.]